MKWRPPETAPRDGRQIIANIGFPCPVVCCWNAYHSEWAYASMQSDEVAIEGGFDFLPNSQSDTYYETDFARTQDIKGWLPMLEVKSERPRN